MSEHRTFEGELTARNTRFAVIVSRFNGFVVESLLAGALDTLRRHGAADGDIQIVRVPGAFEMPLAAQRLAASKRYDALIALGAVIRGGTPHFEYVAGECVKGLAAVSREHGIALGFGVLTCNTVEQAIERAGAKAGNNGADAAMSAIEMVNLLRNLGT